MPPRQVLIVGGGPAAAAAALALAQAGVSHLLIERTAEPTDPLCGGFLSWRTLELVERFGIAGEALNPSAITHVLLTHNGRAARAALPRPARCVSRRRLDAMLLERAERAGAAIERGVGARGWDQGLVRTDDGAGLATDAVFLATGKHDLRGLSRPATARGDDPAIGLRVRLGPAQALRRAIGDGIELHLFGGGYAGCALQEDGSANLCMAVRRSRLTQAGSPRALLDALVAESPHLGERLAYMAADPAIDAVANVPYGWQATATERGLFRLGDQAAVIPSLAGEGMGIALASGFAAARAFVAGGGDAAQAFQSAFYRRTTRPLRVAGLVRFAAEHGWSAAMLASAVRIAPPLAGLVAHLTRLGR